MRFLGYRRLLANMIKIKIAKSAHETQECFQIREEVFVVEQRVPVDMERDAHEGAALHFLVQDDGQAIGAARVVVKENGAFAKIGRVAIISSKRGLGLGKALIGAIEKAPELNGVDNFVLETQTHALQFYERMGYQAYGEEFLDAGIPHRHMKKRNRRLAD
jgi:predicted GNAT family N-acyltransferase